MMKAGNTYLLIAFLLPLVVEAQNADQQAYIDRFREIAVYEMQRTGIPASIKLAQGILESNWGKSELARESNNHFGIKCGANWKGKKNYKKDDDYDRFGRLTKSCFRGYRSAEDAYTAHSDFLLDPRKASRYGDLFQLGPTDYKAWAIGLKKAGYATSPTYHKKLIDIIERYQLHRYDRFDPSDDRVLADNRPVRRVDQPDIINDVKFTVARPGENLEAIATRLTVSVKSLINYNEKLSDTRQVLDSGTRIFIQPKRKSYRGRKKWHTVNGESMYDISQKYGIRLSKLYERNAMPEGSEPAEGERIKIRGGDVDAPPALRSSEEKPVLVADNDQRVEEEQYLPEPELEKEDVSDIPEPVFSSPPKSVLRDPFVFHGSDAGSSVDGQTEVAGEPGKLSFVIEPVSSQSPEEEILLEGTFGQESIATPAPEVKEVYHLVRKGETLWSISRRYGTTVEAVKRLNKIKETELRVGSRLRIE